MNFIDFSNKFKNDLVIDIRNVENYYNGIDRRRLFEWQKKNYILKLTNNFYLFQDNELNDLVIKNIACKIYTPSYIGLESALSYYKFIPEAVFQTTCITTRRNKTVKTKGGDFNFHKIKRDLFFGYTFAGTANNSFYISDPEKTLLDFFYFTPKCDNKDMLIELRLNTQNISELIDTRKLKTYLNLFRSSKVERAVKLLMELSDVEF